jgi:hypothetical protein
LQLDPTSSPLPSHVVISTCLHANLLATAEGLRAQHPGLERFKIAAQQNAGKFYAARVELYPTADIPVQLYDPYTAAFTTVPGSPGAIIEDDFAYFLSSTSCPRLEPTFVILPLLHRLPSEGSMDVMVLRPGRDPRVRAILTAAGFESITQARQAGDKDVLLATSEAWVPRAWEVLGKAYEEGAHVDLTYTANGAVQSRGSGSQVVEVYRCGGFSWRPAVRACSQTELT